MNILHNKIDDFRKTADGKYIQGCEHTCQVLNHKNRNKVIITAVCDLRKVESFDSIVCCGISGLLVAPQIAEILNKHLVVVRKENDKCYSDFGIEGVAPYRYIIIDDLICSGKTVRHIKNTIKDEHPRAICVGVYCYLPDESAYRPGDDGSKLCKRDLGVPLLNVRLP
jgi:adenine/guanine phosphoribosyltransferase-like PRPP-binding protein